MLHSFYRINSDSQFAMQQTRRLILDIIKHRGQVTVDDIVTELAARRGAITAVTVRHHLKLLQQDGLIDPSELRRRSAPGRPQYVYVLTDKAQVHFPNNYERLASSLLHELRQQLPAASINVIFEGVADRLTQDFEHLDGTFEQRLDRVVDYLNANGYQAYWLPGALGYVLHTANCPYHNIAETDEALCTMDMRLISSLLGVIPRRQERISNGDATCSYLIPLPIPVTAE